MLTWSSKPAWAPQFDGLYHYKLIVISITSHFMHILYFLPGHYIGFANTPSHKFTDSKSQWCMLRASKLLPNLGGHPSTLFSCFFPMPAIFGTWEVLHGMHWVSAQSDVSISWSYLLLTTPPRRGGTLCDIWLFRLQNKKSHHLNMHKERK